MQHDVAQTWALCRFYPGQKFFPQKRPFGGVVAEVRFDQKRANRAQSDSRCCACATASRDTSQAISRCSRASDIVSPRDVARARAAHQSPSLLLSSSFTACGLALPPEAFITCPTNQPIAFGLVLGPRPCPGFLATISSTTFSIAPSVGDLLHAALLDDRARIAALAPDDLEQVLGDLARDGAFLDQIEHGAELRRADRAVGDVLALLVEAAGQLVDDPVGRGLGVAPLGHRLEIVGQALLGDQHVGVVGRQAVLGGEARLLVVRQLRQMLPSAHRHRPGRTPAAADRGRGNSGSRAPPPCDRIERVSPLFGSNSRVS